MRKRLNGRVWAFSLIIVLALSAAIVRIFAPSTTTAGLARPAGTTGTAYPAPRAPEGLPDYGTTTRLLGGEVTHPEARQKFLDAYRNRQPGRWQAIGYTDEGDPIAYRIQYPGHATTVHLVRDATGDKFAGQGPRIVEYICQELKADGDTLRLIGCISDGQRIDMLVP